MVQKLGNLIPKYERAAFIAPNAVVVGDVELGTDCSIWYGVIIRGDMSPIRVGDRTNVQDNSVLHVAQNMPLIIGSNVTIGHAAIVHACTVQDNVLIGMGACIMDGAIIPSNCMIGAGALVPPGKTYPEGSLVVGSPARVVRSLRDDEIAALEKRVIHYVENAKRYAESSITIQE
ncbi:MAG: gamma carbonic anhydrase family protein [Spirochaetales bacterium]|jgi:gamma-carbonic anhydrase|nr:gamma carbonic anhydrase family protein [Spirochaetales bacterium]